MNKNIVNFIHFIRGIEPRDSTDLLEPVKRQVEFHNHYNLSATFLYQYDAFMQPEMVDAVVKNCKAEHEIGGWYEIMRPLCEKAGIEWRGRPGFDWDWHAHCGFSVGYTVSERKLLADTYMSSFKKVFGYYPKSVGSWIIDIVTLTYLHEQYGVSVSCNCKEQWGTDGYTLWGGYYSGAYYPSRMNAYMPAQTAEKQLKMPIFKMLGPDVIHQYDFGLDVDSQQEDTAVQQVVTLEPVYAGSTGGGGNEKWVDWFLNENFSFPCLSIAYAQAGQENSFGWPAMAKGLEMQFPKIHKLAQGGNISVQTLGQSGQDFISRFETNPPTVTAALSDWTGADTKSVWYCCKNYRTNLYWSGGKVWLRDFHIFNENYAERYLDKACREDFLAYDTLPVMDGNRFSRAGVRAGAYLTHRGAPIHFDSLRLLEEYENCLVCCLGGEFPVTISFKEQAVEIQTANDKPICLSFIYGSSKNLPEYTIEENKVHFIHQGFEYTLNTQENPIRKTSAGFDVFGNNRLVKIELT